MVVKNINCVSIHELFNGIENLKQVWRDSNDNITWGDCDMSLLNINRFKQTLVQEEILTSELDISNEIDELNKRLDSLPENCMIDIE